ncbi:hypothetical protein RLV_1582 (plasmid) [Rhizobium leguminosarum bv. viciae]|nr:hypothetical protein RLV_1582 [Rhizobium leguminosarum bv. viciae]
MGGVPHVDLHVNFPSASLSPGVVAIAEAGLVRPVPLRRYPSGYIVVRQVWCQQVCRRSLEETQGPQEHERKSGNRQENLRR